MIEILIGIGFVLGLLIVLYIVGILFNGMGRIVINPANILDVLSRGVTRISLLALTIVVICFIVLCLWALGKIVINIL